MGQRPHTILPQPFQANRQGVETLDEHLEGHQMAIHHQKQQSNGDGVDLRQHRHTHSVGRINHGGKTKPHLHGDHLAGHNKQLEQGRQGKPHTHTDEDLLQGDHNPVSTECIHLGHGRDHGHYQDSDNKSEP
mgnify:CR=1 FL=1